MSAILQLANRLRKLKFLLTPKPWRSPFCRDNPFLAEHEFGEWTYGQLRVLSWGTNSKLRVGRYCSIGGGVTIIVDGQHRLDWVTTYPMRLIAGKSSPLGQVVTKGDVVIGHDVWIGDGATILSGVKIGNGAVVGARTVITKDVPAYAVVAGNPARFIRMRFSEIQIASLEKIAWWNWSNERVKQAMSALCASRIDDFIREHSTDGL
jgi:acetyltransferase-like isoleucine patch superfamily enzyme